jgi:protein ImuB
LGEIDEPITPRMPVAPYSVERGFPEPLSRDEDLLATLAQLTENLCVLLQKRDEGARHIVAQFFAADGTMRRIAIGTSRPLRDVRQLHRLLADKFALTSWQDEFGYDRIRLLALVAEPFAPSQNDLTASDAGVDLAHLIDRLGARLGQTCVQRLIAQDSHVPEFASVAIPAASAAEFSSSSQREEIPQDTLALPRPLRLYARPELIKVIAEVPDKPPVRFRWRRVWHEVGRAEGPERIVMPWWRDGMASGTRDYFRVEAKDGARFWLYREGVYGRETAEPRWYVHGLLP